MKGEKLFILPPSSFILRVILPLEQGFVKQLCERGGSGWRIADSEWQMADRGSRIVKKTTRIVGDARRLEEHVILSGAKNLYFGKPRFFAPLRMTGNSTIPRQMPCLFQFQQQAFAPQTAAVSCEFAVFADNAVTGN